MRTRRFPSLVKLSNLDPDRSHCASTLCSHQLLSRWGDEKRGGGRTRWQCWLLRSFVEVWSKRLQEVSEVRESIDRPCWRRRCTSESTHLSFTYARSADKRRKPRTYVIGTLFLTKCWIVWVAVNKTPSTASTTTTAPSATLIPLAISSTKFEWPGVSIKFNKKLFPLLVWVTNEIGVDFKEMDRFWERIEVSV